MYIYIYIYSPTGCEGEKGGYVSQLLAWGRHAISISTLYKKTHNKGERLPVLRATQNLQTYLYSKYLCT